MDCHADKSARNDAQDSVLCGNKLDTIIRKFSPQMGAKAYNVL
ncbi:hypothetical protein [Helicobacter fennelliae]|uniref:Uncharacterized protein n=1 Tax=Helicobacter fennelliae MRY12-0050 TaxID=1325130 RepID=T1DVG1_9HELI|nr:hypothetical protein [Helicobacter fennelliae]GAD18718.1 hypothetical protein HFN_2130 [Helicobacter fennelliae MRY12-0050]